MFEVQDDSNRAMGEFEVVENLPPFQRAYAFHSLGLDDDIAENQKVGDVFPHNNGPIVGFEGLLLVEWDLAMEKFYG
jgi:hypothetical protein